MAPAITFAREGVEVTPFLFAELFADGNAALRTEAGRRIFAPQRRLLEPGELLVQSEAADLYERVAERGCDEFYRGGFAQRLVGAVQAAGGPLTMRDLDLYEAEWMQPARGSYRGVDVVASPPPDQGGTHVIEMLHMIEQLPLAEWGPATESPDTLEWLVRIHNLVLEEGKRQGDPRGHHLPLDLITSKDYAAMRLELLRMTAASSAAPAAVAPPGSNHLTVVDDKGNVATALHSCMALPWTNGLFVDGISVAAVGAHFPRRLPLPGERINSIIAPTMLVRDGRPWLAAGSPSGALLANLIQLTTALVDFEQDLETVVHTPRFGGPSNKVMYGSGWGGSGFTAMLESDFPEDVRTKVEKRGVLFDLIRPWSWENGSLEAVLIEGHSKSACGDPRRYSEPAVTGR
jgi:gamma-glutamyltranspeptidase/glutathione hydrolase